MVLTVVLAVAPSDEPPAPPFDDVVVPLDKYGQIADVDIEALPAAPADAYVVYVAVLRDIRARAVERDPDRPAYPFVITCVTGLDAHAVDVGPDYVDRCSGPDRLADRVGEDLLAAFRRIGAEKQRLEPSFHLCPGALAPVRLVRYGAASAFRSARLREAWRKDHEPGVEGDGIYGFSAVAFDADRSRALLAVSLHCGGRCGLGELVLVARDGPDWKVVDRVRIWAS